MIDLTNAHIDEHRKHTGVFNVRAGGSGWLLGTIGGVQVKLDPMEKVQVDGTYADGTRINGYEFEVPLSVCLKGALAIMEYLTKTYALQP